MIEERRNACVIRSELPTDGFMRLPQVLAVYPVSRSSWWAMVRDRRAPQPVTLGRRCTAWRCADIRALIDATAPKAAA
ncbi:MAG: AlpA family phage regulatory protein [Lysobacteraceae bacterium]